MGISSEHFSDQELACHHCGVNACTQELVDALEQFRAAVGKPVVVDDAYRCAAHNATTPNAAKNSQHQDGTAADVKVPGMSAREMYAVAKNIPAFQQGGIGVAEIQNYIHLDVRGSVARWCYNEHGATAPWDHSLDA
jgi:uncharacterized protein YcbK (DUF882 family)